MDELVWAGAGEPEWARAGTYPVVRLIRMASAIWDAEPVPRQEQIIGRRRSDGAVLGQPDETADPVYAADPDGRSSRSTPHPPGRPADRGECGQPDPAPRLLLPPSGRRGPDFRVLPT